MDQPHHVYWPEEHHFMDDTDDIDWQTLLSLDDTADKESSVISMFMYGAVSFYCMFVVVNTIMWLTCEQRVEKVQMLHTPTTAMTTARNTRPYLIRISSLPMAGGSGNNFVQITLFGSEHYPEEFIVDIPKLNCVYLTHPTSSFLLHITGAFEDIEKVRVMLGSRNYGTQAWSLQYIDIRDVWSKKKWFFPGTPACVPLLIGPDHPLSIITLAKLPRNQRLYHGYFGRALRRYHPWHIMAHSFITQQIYGVLFMILPFGFVCATSVTYTMFLTSETTWPATIGILLVANSLVAVINALLRILVRDCEKLSMNHVRAADEGKPVMQARLIAHDPNSYKHVSHLHEHRTVHREHPSHHGRDAEHHLQHRHPQRDPQHHPQYHPHRQSHDSIIPRHPKQEISHRADTVSPMSRHTEEEEKEEEEVEEEGRYIKQRIDSYKESVIGDDAMVSTGDAIILRFQPDTIVPLQPGLHCPVHGCRKHQCQQAAQTDQMLCVLSQRSDLQTLPVTSYPLISGLTATPVQLSVGSHSEVVAPGCQNLAPISNTVRFAPLPQVIQISDSLLARSPPNIQRPLNMSGANIIDMTGMGGSGDVYSTDTLRKDSKSAPQLNNMNREQNGTMGTAAPSISSRVKQIVFHPNGSASQASDRKTSVRVTLSPNQQTQTDNSALDKPFSLQEGTSLLSPLGAHLDKTIWPQADTNNRSSLPEYISNQVSPNYDNIFNLSNNRRSNDTPTMPHIDMDSVTHQNPRSTQVIRDKKLANTEPSHASEITPFHLHQRKSIITQQSDNHKEWHGNYGSIVQSVGQNHQTQSIVSNCGAPHNTVNDNLKPTFSQQPELEIDGLLPKQTDNVEKQVTPQHANELYSSANVASITHEVNNFNMNLSTHYNQQVTAKQKTPAPNITLLGDLTNCACRSPEVASWELLGKAHGKHVTYNVALASSEDTSTNVNQQQFKSDWECLVSKCTEKTRGNDVLNRNDRNNVSYREQLGQLEVTNDERRKRDYLSNDADDPLLRVIKHPGHCIKETSALTVTTDSTNINTSKTKQIPVRRPSAILPIAPGSNEGMMIDRVSEIDVNTYALSLVQSIVNSVNVDGANDNNNARQKHVDECMSVFTKDAPQLAQMDHNADSATDTTLEVNTNVNVSNKNMLPQWVSRMLRRLKNKADVIRDASRLERKAVFERIEHEMNIDKSIWNKSVWGNKNASVKVSSFNQNGLSHQTHISDSPDHVWRLLRDVKRPTFKEAVMKLVKRQCELQSREFATDVVYAIYAISHYVLARGKQLYRMQCPEPYHAHAHAHELVNDKKDKLTSVLVCGLVFLIQRHAQTARMLHTDLSAMALENIPDDKEFTYEMSVNKTRLDENTYENNENINSNISMKRDIRDKRKSSILRSPTRSRPSIGKQTNQYQHHTPSLSNTVPHHTCLKDVIKTRDNSRVDVDVRVKDLYSYIAHKLADDSKPESPSLSESVALQAVAKTCILLQVLKQACRILLSECTCLDKVIPSCLESDLDGLFSTYITILQRARRERGMFYLKVACLTVAERLKRNVDDHTALLHENCLNGVHIDVKSPSNDDGAVHIKVLGAADYFNCSNNHVPIAKPHGDHTSIHDNMKHHNASHHDNKHHDVTRHGNQHHEVTHHDTKHHDATRHHDTHHHGNKHHDITHHGITHHKVREDYIITSRNTCCEPIGPYVVFVALLILLVGLHVLTLFISKRLTTRASWHCLLSVLGALIADLTIFQLCVALARAFIGSHSATFDNVEFHW